MLKSTICYTPGELAELNARVSLLFIAQEMQKNWNADMRHIKCRIHHTVVTHRVQSYLRDYGYQYHTDRGNTDYVCIHWPIH